MNDRSPTRPKGYRFIHCDVHSDGAGISGAPQRPSVVNAGLVGLLAVLILKDVNSNRANTEIDLPNFFCDSDDFHNPLFQLLSGQTVNGREVQIL